MKRIDTAKIVRNLKDEAYKFDGQDLTVGHVLAETLASFESGGKMKLFTLAQRAYKSDGLTVDEVDQGLIEKALERSTQYSNIIIGQAMLAVQQAEDDHA